MKPNADQLDFTQNLSCGFHCWNLHSIFKWRTNWTCCPC